MTKRNTAPRLQDHPHRVKYLVKAKGKSERDEINKLALFCLLGSLYDMEVRAKQHGDGTTDPNYYLRYQLSWLGKTYDPTRWVDYRQTQDGLLEYLGSFHGGDFPGLPQSDHPVKVGAGRRWTALVGAIGLGDGDALLLAFQDVGSRQLGDSAEDGEHELAGRSRGNA